MESFFNLEKVGSIFVEFFIKEQYYQSWNKAHPAAQGKLEEKAGGHLHVLSKRQRGP